MKTTMNVLLMLVFGMSISIFANGELRGTVKDSLSSADLEMVSVTLQSGVMQFQAFTDGKGEYIIKRIPPGKYEAIFQRTGYHTQIVKNVVINNEQISYIHLSIVPTTLKEVVIRPKYYDQFKNSIGPHTPSTLVTIEAKELMTTAMERGPIDAIATFVPRVVQTRPGAPLNFSGSRGDAALYMIDGIKVIGEAFVPQMGIQEVVVITGGLPAEFGDTTSGLVYITTKSFQ
jgi:hypothetical protein